MMDCVRSNADYVCFAQSSGIGLLFAQCALKASLSFGFLCVSVAIGIAVSQGIVNIRHLRHLRYHAERLPCTQQ